MEELIVVWDGSHGNRDQDLLCVPEALRNTQRLGTLDELPRHLDAIGRRVKSQPWHDGIYRQVVAILSDGRWHRVPELAETLCIERHLIVSVLDRLRRQLRLASKKPPVRTRTLGVRAYRLKQEAREAA